MKLVKSLLLGSAAGLVAVAGAQAADLPVKKAAPVEYVRVCSAYGAGFFYIPGTDTCLRVSGRARFEYSGGTQRAFTADTVGFRSLGRLNLDARTQTAYGTLRTFVRMEMARRTGFFRSGTQERRGEAISASGFDFAGRAQNQVYLDKAFIQFAGFTAGRATSFFDFYSNDFTWFGIAGSDRGSTNLLAYTATFGTGFSATIAMEDPQERRVPVISAQGLNGPFGAVSALNPLGPNLSGLPGVTLGGNQRNGVPDIVGTLRVDQAWGSAQLSAASHQINVTGGGIGPLVVSGPNSINTATTLGGIRPGSEYGFAVQGGVKLNAPMIAPGDALYLQAAYANGALDYTLSGANAFGGATSSQGFGKFNFNVADAVIDPNNGRVRLTNSFTALASFLHYWTPQFRQAVFGAYANVDFPQIFYGPGIARPASGFVRDFHLYQVGTNLIYSPVRDLDIGVEFMYEDIRLHGARVPDLNRFGLRLTREQDQFVGRLRVQRDF